MYCFTDLLTIPLEFVGNERDLRYKTLLGKLVFPLWSESLALHHEMS